MFEPAELRSIIEAADQPIRAMILLGVNCGFGNADVGTMPMSAVDLDGGWVQFPRPKTGTARRCPLWSETVTAIRESLAGRPEPKSADDAGLLFVTKYGQSWAKDTTDNPVSKEFAKLLKRPRCPKCGKIEAAAAEECSGCKWKPAKGNPWQTLYRTGRNFYALRHCFETIGGESRDQVAVDHIMGHIRDDMASVYREGISDDRLRAVVNCVRAWLWPKMDAPAPAAGNTGQEQ
jgi:integrase